jgi:hypothetical protein
MAALRTSEELHELLLQRVQGESTMQGNTWGIETAATDSIVGVASEWGDVASPA